MTDEQVKSVILSIISNEPCSKCINDLTDSEIAFYLESAGFEGSKKQIEQIRIASN